MKPIIVDAHARTELDDWVEEKLQTLEHEHTYTFRFNIYRASRQNLLKTMGIDTSKETLVAQDVRLYRNGHIVRMMVTVIPNRFLKNWDLRLMKLPTFKVPVLEESLVRVGFKSFWIELDIGHDRTEIREI